MIRIAIVDDHPIVRDGLASAFDGETGFQIVGATGSVEDLVAMLPAWKPDIILLDFEMPSLSGAAAVKEVAKEAPGAGVIVFTAYADEGRIIGAVRSGARGYVLKGAPAGDVARAIRDVSAGGSFFPAQIGAVIARQVREPRSLALTTREREVLRFVADGLSNKQIAQRLRIAERTVKYHVNALLGKLGADNRAQAVAIAARRRLLS